MNGMAKIQAFFLGMKEFKQSITTSFADYGHLLAYEHGRELAHQLTWRIYD